MNDDIKRVAQEPIIKVTATLRLDEIELRALALLTYYDSASVVKALQEKIVGNHQANIFNSGITSLLEMVSHEVRPILRRADAAREAFKPKVPAP